MSCDLSPSRKKRLQKVLFRIALDVCCIIPVAVGFFVLELAVEPYQRGFFCDDESINHPYKSDTVTIAVAVVVGCLIPISMIIIIEILLRANNKKFCLVSKRTVFTEKMCWMSASYAYIIVFIFGMVVTQFLTDIGKISIGRLRPHFLTLCAPDFTKIDCSKGYITEDVCTSTDSDKLREARLSFPSGHSSFAMYSMVFSMLYLQGRVSCKSTFLLKPVLLVFYFALGFYCCLSRISDYKHHWSDVLAGAILGIIVAVCVVKGLTDLGPNLCGVRVREMSDLGELSNIIDSKHNMETTTMENSLNNASGGTIENSHIIHIDTEIY